MSATPDAVLALDDRPGRPPEAGGPAAASPQVLAFCDSHGIRHHLDRAVELVAETFPSVVAVHAEIDHDPDAADDWVTVRAVVRGEPDQLVRAEGTYTAKWVAEVPPPERFLVRLSLDAASP